MKLALTFGDPQTVGVDHVRGWADLAPGEFDAGTRLPASDSHPGTDRPLVVVRLDGWANERTARLRVLVWSDDEDAAWALASYLHGRALAHTGCARCRGYLYSTGPDRSTDPDFGTPLSAFTIRVKMRAEMIAADPRDPRTTTDA